MKGRLVHTIVAALIPLFALAGDPEKDARQNALATTRTNPIDGLTYVRIPSGSFQMGCAPGDGQCSSNEKPRHQVTIRKAFWMGRTEVTAGAYEQFSRATGQPMPPEPENYKVRFNPGWQLKDHPVVNVERGEAQAYCQWAGGRLPTEAEWEYAARGGRDGLLYPWGNTVTHDEANYGADSCCDPVESGRDRWRFTAPAGSFAANDFGLYDTSGNVGEFVADYYDPNYYQRSPAIDPTGGDAGWFITRGGSWWSAPDQLRLSSRTASYPGRYGFTGFRCVQEADASESDGAPAISAVVNAASFEAGPVAAGEIVSIMGERMGPEQGVQAGSENGRCRTSAAGVSVYFDGVEAPLFFVRRDQINAQVPYSVHNKPDIAVEVVYDGLRSKPFTVRTAASAPGLFMFLDGSRRAVVLHANGGVVGPDSPAKRGEIVVFWATGEGQTDPPGVEGKPTEPPYPKPVLPVSLTIGGAEAKIDYAGPAPGFAGLCQVNARIPDAAPGGEKVPVVFQVGSANSQAELHMAVAEGGAPPPPTVTISAEPASIRIGESAVLTWSSANATSATLDQGIGAVPVSGSRSVSPSATTTYSITVRGDGGSAQASATVVVTDPRVPAEIMSPVPGSVLSGNTVTFQWTEGVGVSQYYLKIGNAPGAGDIYDRDQGKNRSATVAGIPEDARTIHVRLSSRIGEDWRHKDYTYKARSSQASFQISNLRIGTPKKTTDFITGGTVVTIPLVVDFVDPSGTAKCDTLNRDIGFYVDGVRYIHVTGGVKISGQPCDTSGTLTIDVTFRGAYFKPGLTVTVIMKLINARGQESNTLTGTYQS